MAENTDELTKLEKYSQGEPYHIINPSLALTVYRYIIKFNPDRTYQSVHEIQVHKKISKIKLWIIRKILGWRLELQ